MNTSSFDCSLNDLTELKKLIIENPDLPLLIFCGEESWSGNWGYEQAIAGKPYIEELTLYGDRWMDHDEYQDRLSDDLCDLEEYKNMSNEDYFKMINDRVAETEFVKAIVIYVG